MMKRIYCLGCAALGVALLSACGSTDAVKVDMSKLSTGDNNQVSTGGYIWTYTDHNTTATAPVESDPKTWDYHAIIDPVTSPTVALKPIADTDTTHGNVINVKGKVPGKIPWTLVAGQDPIAVDTYWPKIYPDAMVPAYPAAGLGFGFKPGNEMFDATGGGKYIGVAFDLKINVDQQVVWFSIPMAGTDVPDPNNDDKFTKTCDYYRADNNPDKGGSSCFTSYRKGIFSSPSAAGTGTTYNTLAAKGTWKRFCVLYSEVGVPNWANTKTLEMMALIPFDPTKAIKVQWEQFQPADGFAVVPAAFDMSIDNINLLTEAQAKDAVNNCDVSAIGQPYKNAATSAS